MRKIKRSFRRMILVELLKHLQSSYDFELKPDAVRRLLHSNVGMDALFSFRSDSRLNDLKRALTQLDEGLFGICIGCKTPMSEEELTQDITRRLCSSCESGFNHHLIDHATAASLVGPRRTFSHSARP